jgi:hypothetical protein
LKPAAKKSKKATFAQIDAQPGSDDSDEKDEPQGHQFTSFGFVNPSTSPMNLQHLILLLDNQSTVDLFCNRSLVTRVWKTEDSMTVHGNGGNLTTKNMAHITNYGDVWFHPSAITNILCLKNVKKQFRVTYDSELGDGVFVVHKPNGNNLLFYPHADGLHYHDTRNRQLAMVTTVVEEYEGFSKKQIEQAKTARDFQAKVGHPRTTDLKEYC